MFENDYLLDRVEAALAAHRSPARVTGEIAGRYIILTLSSPVQDTHALTADVRRATGAHTVEIIGIGDQQSLVIMWQDARPAIAAEHGPMSAVRSPFVAARDVIVIGG